MICERTQTDGSENKIARAEFLRGEDCGSAALKEPIVELFEHVDCELRDDHAEAFVVAAIAMRRVNEDLLHLEFEVHQVGTVN
jgi:hypothetical protein